LLLELLHLPAHQFVKTPALHLRVEHFQSPAVTRLTRAPRPKQPKIERSRQVRIGLAAGGRWIRTLSLCSGLQAFCGFRHPREDQSGLHTGSLLDSRQHGLIASRPREYSSKSAAHFEGHPKIPWSRICAPRRRVPLNQEFWKGAATTGGSGGNRAC
jgi:hypothetical protein